jgi:Rad3-related DNA helicase
MSATIISPEVFCRELGIPDGQWAFVDYPSGFDLRRRPIRIWPAATLSQKTEEQDRPKVARRVSEILHKHPGDRVLIHTVSFDRARFLTDFLRGEHGRRIVQYYSGAAREMALKNFRSRKAAVLIAPGLERGVDFRGDECRVQVCVKVPYPYLGDKQVSARFHLPGGKLWYAVETIRALVQATGRGMRASDDWCQTYILDGAFRRMWDDYGRLFPAWWREAVRFDDIDVLAEVLGVDRLGGARTEKEIAYQMW